MKLVIKKSGKTVQAYRLGEEHEILDRLMEEGKIKQIDEEHYEVFSREAVNGTGEIAKKGDFVKIDSAGFPYPNGVDFFLKNHVHRSGDDYEQLPKPLSAWTSSDKMCEAVEFLQKEKGLVIDEANAEKYFSAPLWGSILSAKKDAVIVFYRIDRDENGIITDADFNFVEQTEFEKTYRIVMEEQDQ